METGSGRFRRRDWWPYSDHDQRQLR